jgi:hypothetical protein
MKLCSVCGKSYKWGSLCKSCFMKAHYVKEREVILQRAKDYVENNRQKVFERKKEYRWENKERLAKEKRDWYESQKKKCFLHYGNGGCSACGEREEEFLVLDHVAGGGNEHRRVVGKNIYSWAIRENFPDGLQVLCRNCNHEKGGVEHRSESKHESRRKVKREVMSHYSNGEPKCACCGERKEMVLCLDHLSGGGGHRKQIGINGGHRTYLWCIKNKFPALFQVLCYNCNWSKKDKLCCVHLREPRLDPVVPHFLP